MKKIRCTNSDGVFLVAGNEYTIENQLSMMGKDFLILSEDSEKRWLSIRYFEKELPPNDKILPIKIVILQRGWVMIGKFERKGMDCFLHDGYVIRNWGTTEGIGQLVLGPTKDSKLEKCVGLVEFDYLTVIATIIVDERKWKKYF